MVTTFVGDGTVIADNTGENWEYYDKYGGFLPQAKKTKERSLSNVVKELNAHIVASGDLTCHPGDIGVMKGGKMTKRPCLHRAPYSSDAGSTLPRFLVTVDRIHYDTCLCRRGVSRHGERLQQLLTDRDATVFTVASTCNVLLRRPASFLLFFLHAIMPIGRPRTSSRRHHHQKNTWKLEICDNLEYQMQHSRQYNQYSYPNTQAHIFLCVFFFLASSSRSSKSRTSSSSSIYWHSN